MALVLYRLGRWCFRRRRLVAALWILTLFLGAGAASTLSGPTSNEFSIPGTESQRAIDVLAERFPQSGVDGATARVVFIATEGANLADEALRGAVDQTVSQLFGAPQVGAVVSPYASGAISPDGRVGYAQVAYRVQVGDLTHADQEALAAAAEPARAAGLGVEFGGDATETQQEQSLAEIIGVVMAAFVLILTLGSLAAAGLPLLNAIISVGLGMMGIVVATGFFNLSTSSSTLALMLGLAVSVDYALFIVFRYRNELAAGRHGEEAMGRAIGTAGSAVVFAGLTVVIALSALSVVGIPFLTAMGLAAAGTVVIAVIVALTLLPAMLGFAGERVAPGRIPGLRRLGVPRPERRTLGARWVALTLRHRLAAVVVSVLTLGVLAVPAFSLQLGMPGEDSRPPESTQRKAYEALAAGFGPGSNGPLLVAVEAPTGVNLPLAAAGVRDQLRTLPGIVAVTEPRFSPIGGAAILTVVPASGPTDPATTTLVDEIRTSAPAFAAEFGAVVAVTGATAIQIDVSDKLDRALAPYLVVVVGLAFVLLLLVFRSVLVPIKATAGFLLSVAATFGAVVAIFQWGWLAGPLSVASTGPIISFLPIFLIGLLFGLAMDYEVFLVTRMREEFVHGADPDTAIATGFAHGARVVTAAAVIMISVFMGFFLAPEPVIQSIGFALAFGVFVDAFLIRMTLVPALLSLLGRWAWWIPAWLDRILPDVDVEGARLQIDAPVPEQAIEVAAAPSWEERYPVRIAAGPYPLVPGTPTEQPAAESVPAGRG
ncbi:MAG: MMPL family transporter [Sporichthyaceae bacterium]